MTQAPDTQDFEKLGAFYLGREYNLAAHALQCFRIKPRLHDRVA